ncbi:MAG: rhomboid family intramembrane serine protease [Verrucomicrobiota bacterium]|nr:rhomboid family intramembrane serine protease [Verrucomicrobiota bacterium]
MQRRKGSFDPLAVTIILVCSLFFIFYLDLLLGRALATWGIVPRTYLGLRGVLFSPLLHFNAAHLVANASSLLVMLLFLSSNAKYRFNQTLGLIWILSGFGTWLIGRPAIHIGASGIIYGLVAYLIVAGIYMRGWLPALVGIFIFIVYGGIFYGALPQTGFMSWEGHFSGAVAGILVARFQHD